MSSVRDCVGAKIEGRTRSTVPSAEVGATPPAQLFESDMSEFRTDGLKASVPDQVKVGGRYRVGPAVMQFEGWQRLRADYAAQFGVGDGA